MKTHGIIQNAAQVRAILDGRRTQGRWVVARQNSLLDGSSATRSTWEGLDWRAALVDPGPSPPGNTGPYLKVALPAEGTRHRIYSRIWPGDRLWVREAWATIRALNHCRPSGLRVGIPCEFQAGGCSVRGCERLDDRGKWRPSSQMPRHASRIRLEVTAVSVGQLQDIGSEDTRAEGLQDRYPDPRAPNGARYETNKLRFQHFWDATHRKPEHQWAANPWVWVLTWRRVEA